jgi:hypothetical protein
MIEIKVRFQPDDLAALDHQAAASGISRAQLIRDRAVARLTTVEYHRLVAGAAAFMRGDLSRTQVETLVAYVIRSISSRYTAA